jgi:hypothetical protein
VIRGGGQMLTWGVVGIFEEMHLTEIEIWIWISRRNLGLEVTCGNCPCMDDCKEMARNKSNLNVNLYCDTWTCFCSLVHRNVILEGTVHSRGLHSVSWMRFSLKISWHHLSFTP